MARNAGSAAVNAESVAVRTRELARHFEMGGVTIRAVDGVSLEIQTGEFVALLGPSGSGKSSLLNLLAGLDTPTSGSVMVHEHDLAKLSRRELAQYRLRTVGIVFQSFNLIPSMTIRQNVELPLRFAEVERSRREQLSLDALDRVGLRERVNHRPSELSGGEQQRASMARALVNQPRLLLADEPTGNLDSRTGLQIMDLLRDLNQALGMTVVLVTHEPALAMGCATRMISMADGRLVGDRANVPLVTSGAEVHNESL